MRPIRILILEHDPNDLELLLRSLKKSDLEFETTIADTQETFTQALLSYLPDIILSDFSLPTFNGLSAYKIKCELSPDTPFIIVSGTIGEENAVELIKMGITDYALKEKMFVVPTKIKRALDEKRERVAMRRAEQELAEQHEHTRNILESITDGFFSVDQNWLVQYWNKQAEVLLFKERNEVLGKNLWDEFPEAVSMSFYREYHRAMLEGVKVCFEEFFDPLDIWLNVEAYPSNHGLTVFFRDITEKKRQENLANLEREVLKVYTSQGSTIEQTIKLLFDGIQQMHPQLFSSIMTAENGRLYFWTHSQLPEPYLKSLDGLPILEGETACGTAAYLKKTVTIPDIASASLQVDHREGALGAGLNSCTVFPLVDPYQKVLGTFSVYSKRTGELSDAELHTVERARYILENILENYFSELKLKESEEKYRVLFEQSPTMLMVFDPDTLQLLNVNEALRRHYGYTKEEFLSLNLRDIRPPDALVELEQVLHDSLHLPYFEADTRHQKKNGEIIQVHVQNTGITWDNQEVRLGLITDITEKARIERELELSRRRFEVLVQEGSDLISILNKDGQYTYLSPAYTTLCGYTVEDILGQNAFQLIHPDDLDSVLGSFAEIQTTHRVKTKPFRYKCINGEYIWLETIGTNLLHDPSVEGIVINSRDITESLNSLNAIQRQNDQLREIAWIQSHIVRAPVARIMGVIDLLNNYKDDEGMRAELLNCILASAHELDSVIRSIVEKTERVDGIRN